MAQQLNHPKKKVVPATPSSSPRVLRRKDGIDKRQEQQTPPPYHRRKIQAGDLSHRSQRTHRQPNQRGLRISQRQILPLKDKTNRLSSSNCNLN
ncbi:hypothetical protein F2Q69_00022208 [Brassica cretica]|uniref:Uncharacterized protein n=1 Tax=Brassica cretica TaxID=69181 RepID=A0A8S9Q9W0_BRACR|nr:hypothetical protein F2Q69_00022208 [Brassica cretica]